MKPAERYSPLDYTITITRKNRYLVVGSPEFGYQIASEVVNLDGTTSPQTIGGAVLKVMNHIHHRLLQLDTEGQPHPEPIQKKRIDRLKSREMLACKAAAKALGVSRATLRRMVYAGKLEAERTPGGHLRISLEALSDYLSHQATRNPAAPAALAAKGAA